MTHVKSIANLVFVLAFGFGCLANEQEDDAMVNYLSNNNYLNGKADIVFLLDRSGSVGRADFEVEKGFVESFLTHIVVDVNASRVAVLSFSDTVVTHIDYLKEPKSKCFLAQEMHDVLYEDSGATNTAAALEEARQVLKNARANVSKVVVLVSDGRHTKGGDPMIPAAMLKAEGVQLFCFGIGRAMRTELESLASSLQNVYTCSGFKEFKRLAKKIRGDPHESFWSSQTSKPSCDHLCDSIYKGEPNDPGCCDHDARCSCALLSGLHTCVCKPGFYGLSGLPGNCRACPIGTYKSKLEPTNSCTPCPAGSTTAEVASSKLSDCYCREGYTGNPSKGIPCELITCPPLQEPAHGYIIGHCNTSYGSTCHFMCEIPFYELEDEFSEMRTCKSNGQWTGKTAVCRKARCQPLHNPQNGNMWCDREPLTLGKRCSFECNQGYVRQGSDERECVSSNKWSGKDTKCIPITCKVPPRLVYGTYKGCTWNQRPNYYDSCIYTCNDGFELRGPRYLTCRGNGELIDEYGGTSEPHCFDVTPPDIYCKSYIRATADIGKSFAHVHWEIPLPADNSGIKPDLITDPRGIFPGMALPIGYHRIMYIAIDHAGLRSSCEIGIEVIDEERPAVVKCPGKVEISTNDVSVPVYWEEPEFKDNSNRPLQIYQNAHSGQEFSQGINTVTYAADDETGNRAYCEFDVIVTRNECPYYPPPDNGALACNDWMTGEMCQAYCNEKFDFVRKPAEWYICNREAKWETYPENEVIPWPDCARPTMPGSVRQTVGLYYHGDCNDPRVKRYIKKLFMNHVATSIQYSHLCTRPDSCTVDSVRVFCGEITDNHKRWKRGVWQHAEKELLEVEFEITFNGDQEFTDTEAVLQDFLETIRNLKWDFDEDLVPTTTLSPSKSEPLNTEELNNGPLVVTDEKTTTTLVCKAGSVLTDDLCVLCSAGTFYDNDRQNCVDCPEGYYQENQGQLQCNKCPDGTSTEYPRTRNETLCKGICSPGTHSVTGLETCISCSVGSYQEGKGMDTCYICPNGTTTANVGAASIEDCKDVCAPGSFSQNGLEPCEPCPLHHYQPLPGQMACLECPDELSTAERGATQVNLCIDIDPCLLEITCLNNGSCTRAGRNAKCKCTRGYDGIHCENDIDECNSSPCSDGGVCINTDGSFYCKCLDGFAGDLCEIEINECASTPCQNNGTCIDKVNGYTCGCSNGYEGINCEIQQEICFRDVACQNGVCMFGENDNSSFCVCEPGFTAIDCSLNINECENITCKNNGSCIDGINSFTCACSLGYTGLLCEIDIDECENNTCHSGSTCIDLVGTYKCVCPPGWNGTSCETKMDSNFVLMFPESSATIGNMASMTLTSPLTEATISLWVQTNDTERSGTPLSYAVASTNTIGADGTVVDNALTISDCSEVKIYVNNEPIVTDLQVVDGQWHHLAFTWSSENSGIWALYKDGELKYKGNNLRPHEIISGGGSMVIGQEQDTLGGGFSPVETFTGNITRVNIWNNYFSKSNITRLCNLDDELPDKVLAWPDFLHGLKGDIQILQNSRPVISTTA